MTTPTPETDSDELQAKIKRYSTINESGCWIWNKSVTSRGYGNICFDKKVELAHRVSYKVFVGNPDGFVVCHKCDNPLCVNPEHLFLGTAADNLNDCYTKGRRGIVLTIEQIETIKKMIQDGVSYIKIASQFGTTKSSIHRLKEKGFKPQYL
jgi:hypothetical protein